MSQFRGIAAAQERTDRLDHRIADLSSKLISISDAIAVVALGAYGRRELTPRSEVELLFLHQGELTTPRVSEVVCYPLWEDNLRVEPMVRTLAECAADARRSLLAATSLLDARLIIGSANAFEALVRQVIQPWRRDRERLRHRLRTDAQRRHASHAPAAGSATPDLVGGRGGLLDLQALRWLDDTPDKRVTAALDFLLRGLSAIENLVGQVPARLSARVQDQLSAALDLTDSGLLPELYMHARWVAFRLDGALSPSRDDRQLGLSLAVRRGELVADRLPPLEHAPSFGLRVANLVGLGAPDPGLLAWASAPGPPIRWDQPTLEQFWLLLRAADWRAWDFLDVTGLLIRYLPETERIWRQPGQSGADDLALDSHSFLALRRLHAWTESGDPFAERAWRPLRRRDWLYLGVLLHELSADDALAVGRRLELPDEACEALAFVVGNYRLLADTATRRDLHDEDLLLDLATRIRNRQRLSLLFLVAVAHDLASGPGPSAWKGDLMRQLFGQLEAALRQSKEVGPRRTRSLDHHRARIVRELERRKLESLLPLVARLPRRYVLTRSPAFVARHLSLLAETPLADGQVRVRAYRHRGSELWDLLVVARDRPGLLATMAGVLALRGTSVLAADAATCADGLVLDVFTVSGTHGEALEPELWPAIAQDVQSALQGKLPLADLLGARPLPAEEAESIRVSVDNSASQFFSVVEVRAPDQVGLLYRIAHALHELGLDIHQARIDTHPEGVLDVFYVWDLKGEKLTAPNAHRAAQSLTARLRGLTD